MQQLKNVISQNKAFISLLLVMVMVLSVFAGINTTAIAQADGDENNNLGDTVSPSAVASGSSVDISDATEGMILQLKLYAQTADDDLELLDSDLASSVSVKLTDTSTGKIYNWEKQYSSGQDIENGTIRIQGVAPGTYTLEISYTANATAGRVFNAKKEITLSGTESEEEDAATTSYYEEDTSNQFTVVFAQYPTITIETTSDSGLSVSQKNLCDMLEVENLSSEDENGITESDLAAIQGTTNYTLTMSAKKADDDSKLTTEQKEQKAYVSTAAASDGYTVLNYYDFSPSKTAATTTPLAETGCLQEIRIALSSLSSGFQRASGYYHCIYRYHESANERVQYLPQGEDRKNAYGEYYEFDSINNELVLHVKKFCVYALAQKMVYYGPAATSTPVPTATPEPTAEVTATPEPTAEVTATPEPTAEVTATPEPTEEVTAAPEPTEEVTAAPEPTAEVTEEPAAEPTATPEPEKIKVKKILLEASKSTAKTITLTWNKVPNADGYDLYHAKCNTKEEKHIPKFYKTINSPNATSFKLKGLKKDTWYKDLVYAWKMVNGKKVIIGKSLIVHRYVNKKNADTKWGNPIDVKVSVDKLTIKKGKSKTLTGKTVVDEGKKLGNHGSKIRYVASNDAIISVSNKGKIKAKKKGTCTLYVVAQSGLKKKVKVTVK